jgi:hypothetical protein
MPREPMNPSTALLRAAGTVESNLRVTDGLVLFNEIDIDFQLQTECKTIAELNSLEKRYEQ